MNSRRRFSQHDEVAEQQRTDAMRDELVRRSHAA